MKTLKTILLLTAFTLVGIFAAGTMKVDAEAKAGNIGNGAKLWTNTCQRCHNLRDAADLTDADWGATMMHMRVRAGLTGQDTRHLGLLASVKWRLTMKAATTVTIIAFLTLGASNHAADGKKLYQQTCLACHGADGKGTVPGAPDFTKKNGRLSKKDAVLLKNMWKGFQSKGSPMAMPPKGANPSLTKKDIKVLLDYMRDQFVPHIKKTK